MDKSTAIKIISKFWSGHQDPRVKQAAEVLGLDLAELFELKHEAQRVERHFYGVILTPCGT